MAIKIVSGILALALFIVYTGAIAVKLKDAALIVVILIGLVLMMIDLWETIRERDD